MHNALPLSLLALLSVLSTSSNATPLANPSLTIPLTRRSQVQESLDDKGARAFRNRQAVHAKYGLSHTLDKRASGQNLLTNLELDSSYFGSIAVGTPPTAFDVILDTGSADLWLATERVGSQPIDTSSSSSISLFSPSSSSTFSQINTTFQIEYGTGAAEGTLGSDVVQFAGFEVNPQIFGLVTQTSQDLLTTPLSGLMGLAFKQLAASDATPFWQAIVNQNGALDSPLMAFQLTRFLNDTNAQPLEPGGTFTFGSTNSSLFTGNIDYQNIPDGSPGFWILELADMTVQGQSISLPGGQGAWAAIDTGTTGFGLPSDVQQEVFAAIPGSQPGTGQWNGYYTYPCSANPSVTLKFGSSSVSWPISSDDFNFQQIGQDTCVGSFFALNNPAGTTAPPFIIGDTFLKNVYSVFRASPASVGFAALSSTATSMNGVNAPAPSPTVGSSPVSVSGTSSSGASRSISALSGSAWFGVVLTTIMAVLVGPALMMF